MIHSLAGGELKRNKLVDIAKVQILDGIDKDSTYWFINPFIELKIDDKVIVPLGKHDIRTNGIVLRIDKNANEQVLPYPLKRMKEIISIINE